MAVGPRIGEGSEETPPTRRIALPLKGEAERLGNRAETTRPPGPGNDACTVRSVPAWNVETAVLQVERANGRQ